MADLLLVEERGDVVWWTINRPDARNALSRELNLALQDAVLAQEHREDIHAIVVTGAGDKAFCAGADLKERRGIAAADTAPYINAISGAINAVGELKKPVIAAMNGSAYGGGLELALACDFRVIVEGAELGLTEVRLGIMPGAGGTQRLPRLIGEARAKEMIMLGRRVSAQRAFEIGLVSQVVQAGKLPAAIDALLAELRACAPLSVLSAKSAIQRGYGQNLEDGIAIERECYEMTLFSEDRDEGLAAFAEGRAPSYLGR